MRSANEVVFIYTMNRASILTSATAGTLAVIDGSKVVYNLDSTLGAYLFALSASDTANGAILANLRAFVMVRALNDNSRSISYKADITQRWSQ